MPLLVDAVATLPGWLQALVIIGAAVVLAYATRLAIGAWIGGSERLARTNLDRLILDEFKYPLYFTVILLGVLVSLGRVDLLGTEPYLARLIVTLIILLAVRTGIRIGGRINTHLQEVGRELEFGPVLKNVWSFFLLLGAFFILLSVWDVDITPLLASAGLLGIVLGIAAQDSLGNFFAGISLNLDKTYRVGDMIQLEDGTRGTVTELSVRSTTILTRDNIDVTIPNSELNQTKVINESAPQRRRRIRLDVGVAYGSDLEEVEEAMLAVAQREPIVLDNPAPVIRFRSFDDSAIRAQLQCFIEHPALWGRARHVLIQGISREFGEQEIKIPFPQRELTFFESENEIRLDRGSVDDFPDEVPSDIE